MAEPASCGYCLGVMLLLLGSLFYAIGYSSPYWTLVRKGFAVYSGLWYRCVSDSHGVARPGASGTRCTGGLAVTGGEGWFKIVQALQSLGLIGVVVSCIYSIVTSCCQSMPRYTRFLEIFAGGSGVVGFVSVMIYVAKTATFLSDYYSWAFGLDLAGCIIVIIAALIIAACSNNRDNNASTTKPVYDPGDPVQGGNTVVMQSYGPGPYQPPGGVAGYPQAYAMPPQYPAGMPPQYPAGMLPQYPAGMPPQYPAGMPPQYPAGMPPQYPSAPPQEYSCGAPPPPEGYGAQLQGSSGYN